MSGTLSINSFNNVVIRSVAPTITTIAVSGVRQSKQLAAQYWEMDLEYAALTRADFARVMGFISKQRVGFGDFEMIIPEISRPAGDIRYIYTNVTPQTMVATAEADAGDSYVDFDTGFQSTFFTNNGYDNTQGLVAGDFIRFTNHDKVYQLTEDVTFDVNGAGRLNLFPNLVEGVNLNETIQFYDVPFKVYLKTQTQDFAYNAERQSTISLQVRESLL